MYFSTSPVDESLPFRKLDSDMHSFFASVNFGDRNLCHAISSLDHYMMRWPSGVRMLTFD